MRAAPLQIRWRGSAYNSNRNGNGLTKLSYEITLLQRCLPQPVKVAILIHGNRTRRAGADDGLGLIAQIDTDTAILRLDIDECDVVLGQHRVRHATHFDFDRAVVNSGNDGQVLLDARLDGIGHELLHLLATTNNGDIRIDDLLDHIAAMAALKKLGCHN